MVYTFDCFICKISFNSTNPKGRFCSKRCKDKDYRERHKEVAKLYHKKYYKEHREPIIKRVTDYYQTHKLKPEQYARHNNSYRLSGMREQVYAKYESKCHFCKTERGLVIHHIDEVSTVNSPKNKVNNSLDNLMLLCRACHLKIHNYHRK